MSLKSRLIGFAFLIGASSAITLSAQTPVLDPPLEEIFATPVPGKTIGDVASGMSQFEILMKAAKSAGIADGLKGNGPYTLFAPTDEAFHKLPEGMIESLLKEENAEKLRQILLFHLVAQGMTPDDINKAVSIPTVNGQRLTRTTQGDIVQIDAAKLLSSGIPASNGLIYPIDTVLLPEDRNVAEVLTAGKQFSSFLVAAQGGEVLSIMATQDPITVFAPTDAAFDALGTDGEAQLMLPENKDKLRHLMRAHLVADRVHYDEILEQSSVQNMAGETLQLQTIDGVPYLQKARFVQTDIDASNGVIHVIDRVLTTTTAAGTPTPAAPSDAAATPTTAPILP